MGNHFPNLTAEEFQVRALQWRKVQEANAERKKFGLPPAVVESPSLPVGPSKVQETMQKLERQRSRPRPDAPKRRRSAKLKQDVVPTVPPSDAEPKK